jgi:rhodanese-related sulfurtransferase
MEKALMMEPFITMDEIRSLEHTREDRWLFLDVRPHVEYLEEHAVGSMNVPIDELDKYLPAIRARALGRTIVLVTHEDRDAQYAFDHLEARQISDCLILKGGLSALKDAGEKMVRGSQAA